MDPASNGRPGVLGMIGNTPMVELTQFDAGPCRLFVKLENQNPGGSIKDRIGLSMIEAAEREGKLQPGSVLVEATAGNTGLGLALVAARKGYRLILVVPDKMAREKILHLQALGTDVRLTRSDVSKGHPAFYMDLARSITAETPGAWLVDQFNNPANPLAHETTTGPEIWEQMDGDVDAVVCGVGSGGTLTGLGRFFARVSPKTKMVLADPVGSALAGIATTGEPGPAGSYSVEGIGNSTVPGICDLSFAKRAFAIPDAESMNVVRDLLRLEGILAGTSAGALVAAALRYAREQTEPKRIVTFICDTGNKYLSKAFNDAWMREQGYVPRTRTGDVRDLLVRRFDEGGMSTVGPEDSLGTAYNRMRAADVSQLPVLEGERLVGLVDESDLLHAVAQSEGTVAERFAAPVRTAMVTDLEVLPPTAPVSALTPIFDRDRVAIIQDGERFLGLVTRVDLINHLRTS